MPNDPRSVVIVGGGVFGAAAAWELARRGRRVTLCDPGPLPHPDASSTDISKAVRMDYGADELYTELAERSIEGWRRWNERWSEPLYHEDGFLIMARAPLRPGDFEHDGWTLLRERGRPVQRLDGPALERRFPAWNGSIYVDGYFNPIGGWAESGRVVDRLTREAERSGARLRAGDRFRALLEDDGRVCGVLLEDGARVHADQVLVTAGAWTPKLLPWLADRIACVGQPVLHFKPEDPAPFLPERFPVWGADISNTGWYGFPLNRDGIVKVGHHGAGVAIDPDAPREVDPRHERRCRAFLAESFPALADAEIVGRRVCLYADSFDGDFLVDGDPERPGLFVAGAGSGHGFKFAPLLGPWIADLLDGKPPSWSRRFRWRAAGRRAAEQARFSRENG